MSAFIATTFRWRDPGRAHGDVRVAGDFGGDWCGAPLVLRPALDACDWQWSVVVLLPSGEAVRYKYIIDGAWRVDASLPTETDASGNVNNVLMVGDGCDGATAAVPATRVEPPQQRAAEQEEDPRDVQRRELHAKLLLVTARVDAAEASMADALAAVETSKAAAKTSVAAAEAGKKAAEAAAAAAVAAARKAAVADAKNALAKATCVICADIWELPVTAPGCGHVGCKACLMDSASRKNECPQCRKELVEEKPHAATAVFPTFASKAVFEWPVCVPLRELADEARAKEEQGSAAERSATAAARLLRLLPCRAPAACFDERVWPIMREIITPTDASLADSRGRSLLWWACNKGLGLVELLIDQGADVNAADTHFKRTPLMASMTYSGWQYAVKALLAKGANVHAVSNDGMTALDELELYLRYSNNADFLEYLLLLAEADAFRGEAPPAKFTHYLSLAVSKRAHANK